jgi:FkbM family methyltransferase|tara:strand:+ start:7786 stop:8529 length:744 start_codon:yes stop_codon:yes gene_type:complete
VKIKLISKNKISLKNNYILTRYKKNLDYVFLWMMKLNLKKPVILDVGANIGMYSICYSKLFSDANIYAFEPVKKNYQTLIQNIKNNKIKNIIANNFGLLDKKKFLKIGIPDPSTHKRYKQNINDGLFSIFAKKKKFKIKVDSLDAFIKKKKINKIDFIKIDVEGAEFQVLKGAKKTISKYKPIIQLEFNELTEVLGNKKINFFQNFAKKFDYKIYYLTKGYNLKKNINLKNDFFSDLILLNEDIKLR